MRSSQTERVRATDAGSQGGREESGREGDIGNEKRSVSCYIFEGKKETESREKHVACVQMSELTPLHCRFLSIFTSRSVANMAQRQILEFLLHYVFSSTHCAQHAHFVARLVRPLSQGSVL